jgi:methylated-DNA-protein-cysteine methyltransferase-like protein
MPPRQKPALKTSFYTAVYTVVSEIPRGRVVAYGWVASWLGSPRGARAVGYALAAVPDDDVPWQRVINAQGQVSVGGALWRPERQQQLLMQEGVAFGPDNTISLKQYGFRPTPRLLNRWLELGERSVLRNLL